jgi:hypothetical protein
MVKSTQKVTKYIEPSIFFNETLKSIRNGQCSEELGSMFMLLSSKYVNSPKFVRYFHLRDDLIATGAMACLKAYDKFRPNRNILERNDEGEITKTTPVLWDGKVIEYDPVLHYSPFAYFTTTIHNAIIQTLKKEYNEKNIVNAIRVEEGLEADFGYNDMIEDQERKQNEENVENSELFIDSSYDERTLFDTSPIEDDEEETPSTIVW